MKTGRAARLEQARKRRKLQAKKKNHRGRKG